MNASLDGPALARSLHTETERIRVLVAECRYAGVFLEDLPEELEEGRTLLRERKADAALEHLRGIRLDLLGRLLLTQPTVLAGQRAGTAPIGGSPSPEALERINANIDRMLAPSARIRPPP